jgi:3-phenylpropionate/cinnamic acid dioxygenase small subunit
MTTRVSISRSEAEDFLYKEARLIDSNQLWAWRDLMTDDVTYWVPLNDDDSDPNEHLSIIWDDRENLSGRIWRILESGLNHSQDPPSRMIRFISNVEVEPAEREDEVTVQSCLWLATFKSGAQRVDELKPVYYAARQQHRLRRVAGSWLIAFKKVSLLEMDGHLNYMTHII